MRVLIVGGAGVFGRRLAQALAQTPGIEVVIGGRNAAKAHAAAAEAGAAAAVALDRTKCTAEQIRATGAGLVIDAAGPFQGADLAFARAVIASRAHYVDLADARDFVAAFPTLYAEARAAGVIAVTGASSTPALTHAIVDKVTAGWTRIDHIRAGISTTNRVPAGDSAMAAVLSWVGAPVRVFEGGAWRTRRGWGGTRRRAMGALGRRGFSLAETPDLDLLVSRYRPRDGAVFEAGLGLGASHRVVQTLACLRQAGWLRNPAALAPMLGWIARRLSFGGSKRSGMFVEVFGRNAQDGPARSTAHVTAYDGFGPYIPTIPALVMARKIARGDGPDAGAYACVGLLTLAELAAELPVRLVQFSDETQALGSPIALALGDDFENAPRAVRDAHRDGPIVRMRGAARVEGPSNALAALVAWVIGFPRTAAETTAEAEFRALADGRELWKRRIGGRAFESVLIHRGPNLCVEKFGTIELDLDVRLAPRGVRLDVIGWRVAGMPMPRFLAPRSVAYEGEDEEGRYTFDAPIALPLIGRLTHYRGFLTPAATPEIAAS